MAVREGRVEGAFAQGQIDVKPKRITDKYARRVRAKKLANMICNDVMKHIYTPRS